MGYLKITQYLYLVAAGIFAFDAITHWNDEPKPWISFGIALVSLFLFFFRRHFAKKFQDRQNAQGRK